MVIIEQAVPGVRGGSRLVGLSGSCRLLDGPVHLAEAGFQRALGRGGALAHTLAQTVQNWRELTGALTIDPQIAPYVLALQKPAFVRMFARMLPRLDVLFAEVCDTRQMVVEGVFLNTGAITSGIVQPNARQLTPWFGELSRTGAATPATVDAAVEAMRAAGRLTPVIERLIRGTTMPTFDRSAIAAQLDELKALVPCRIVLVGHTTSPDEPGAAFAARRVLNAELVDLAREAGCDYFDPSVFLAHRPRAEVFDADGRDIHHFSPSQHMLMGHAVAALAAEPGLSSEDAVQAALRAPEVPASRAPLLGVDTGLFAALSARVDAIGLKASGLEGHYAERLAHGTLFNDSRRSVFDWVVARVPRSTRIALVGTSAGELPLALAAAGYQVEGWVGSKARVASAEAATRTLEVNGLIPVGAARFHPTKLPTAGRFDLLIAVDLSIVGPEGDTPAMLTALARARQAVIEVRHFGRKRAEFAEQVELFDGLAAAGWVEAPLPTGEGIVLLSRRARGWRRLLRLPGLSFPFRSRIAAAR